MNILPDSNPPGALSETGNRVSEAEVTDLGIPITEGYNLNVSYTIANALVYNEKSVYGTSASGFGLFSTICW